MDVFNKSPHVAEDTLHYSLFPSLHQSDLVSVTALAASIQDFVAETLPNFIWHRDAFELKVVPNPETDGYILEGRMRVGDSVDDEWCTVWLLREISARWDLVISVYDSDGEFLLIEAAEALPTWVKPTNSENRVWIYRSRLHLVPLSHVSPPSRNRRRRKLPGSADSDDERNDDDDDNFISASDAIKLVRDSSVNTLAPSRVESIVWERISAYPDATKSHAHVTKAHLPSDIVKALVANPSLVQKAVEAFYTRDALQLRAAHRMSRFPPTPSVLNTVKLSRAAYAQLLGQKFFPPKIFGQWSEPEGSKERRWRDVGMKIAVGFEMLYQESRSKSNLGNGLGTNPGESSSEARKDALQRNPEYVKYIQNLVSAGYFKGEVEGSAQWRDLESKAAKSFIDVQQEDNAARPSFATQVDDAIANCPVIPPSPSVDEDNDDWLNVDADDFEAMLTKSMRPTKEKPGSPMEIDDIGAGGDERVTEEQTARLQKLAAQVEGFVEGEGELEGARFEGEDSSDGEFSDDDDDDEDEDTGSEEDEGASRQAALDALVAPLAAADYGQMPSSFSQSQKTAPATIQTDSIQDGRPTKKNGSDSGANTKPIRKPLLARDRYDGVDSDDETDEEVEEDEESEEERPQVVGEVEVDMDEEGDEFLEFSRQALGISDSHWSEIIKERKDRGAFIPPNTYSDKRLAAHMPKPSTPPPAGKARPEGSNRSDQSLPPNPKLDSFEAVMKAMDEELARSRTSGSKAPRSAPADQPKKEKGKGKATTTTTTIEEEVEDDVDMDIEAALEALSGADFTEEDGAEEPMDYNLIKNFLESFKSQGGLSGPVSNLMGQLQPGWVLPRDEGSK